MAVAAALLAVAAILLVFPVWSMVSSQPNPTACNFPGQPQQAPGFPAGSAAPAKLVLINGQTTTLAFNRALTTKTLTIQYGISGIIPDVGPKQYPNLQVNEQDFLRSDQVALPSSRVKVAAWYQSGRVLLKLCVDRSGSKLADPGTYQGTVSIVDPRVNRVDVPIIVTLSYPSWQLVLELLVLAVFAGSWYIWVLKQKKASDLAIGWEFVKFCGSMIGVLSIGAGVVAALGVYNATYLSSDSWGSSAEQPLALLGAMFSAFLAGATTVHVGAAAGQARDSRTRASTRADVTGGKSAGAIGPTSPGPDSA